MARFDFTAHAQTLLGGFVQSAGKSFVVVSASDALGEPRTIKITPENPAQFFATQANNLTSGCRTLAGLTGDWRPISELANAALGWFKQVNIVAMRRAGRRVGLEPRF